ncbi:serine O-acetyltransferase-like [Mizuhopecten yessoensis]|uniref:Serine-O-acetyltransferase cys2 n=1 Tax=Mizuhopecten yessoensis TaxID=6573 RepID=A0A210PH73_MIZYE|nr:serine O-acetyltransferase-like [Mizuhopecten yessoensis]OWF35835.1 serine-O-acetyltransferase cys2 [Mizuhopecten yessoensis]
MAALSLTGTTSLLRPNSQKLKNCCQLGKKLQTLERSFGKFGSCHNKSLSVCAGTRKHKKLLSRKFLTEQINNFHRAVSPVLSKSTDVKYQLSRPRLREEEDDDVYDGLPQVDTPTFTEEVFKGMSTEFPCLTRNKMTGPEPDYDKISSGYKTFTSKSPFPVKYNNAVLPEVTIAYETWGELNEARSNAVIIHAGLSASSHAKSHEDNFLPGWWEKFVGPGCAVDTDKFFVICTNNIGSCYGSTGPSSVNPITGKQYATTFPVISIDDMVNAQFLLLDHLGIEKLYGSVGSSLGGMCSLLSASLHPDRVERVVSISSCAQSHPTSISMRYLQRKTIMCDPNWNKGYYYNGKFPKIGMKLAREIATLTYRSGPEWDKRFGRGRIDKNVCPSLCPSFLIESYLEHQGESFSTKYDPNSLLYISKAMDLFDISEGHDSLHAGLSTVQCPTMILGVQTDILFPIWQQRQLARILKESGNPGVTYYELDSLFGHDTFLLDLNGVGAATKGFLETELRNKGHAGKEKTFT